MNNWSKPEYQRLTERLKAVVGLTFPMDRTKSSECRINSAMKECGFSDISEFESAIQKVDDIHQKFVDNMVVGETYFQREYDRISFVRDHILPALKNERGLLHQFKIWSAGCSTGEEAYTLSALMTEVGLQSRFDILATDISLRSLQKAFSGHYSKWSFRGVNASFIEENFLPTEHGWQVKEALKNPIAFQQLNLMDSDLAARHTQLSGTDLIFCRNVLIYFTPEKVAAITREFYGCLSEGGWLVTGASDPPLSAYAPFEMLVTKEGSFYRKAPAAKVATGAITQSATLVDSKGLEGAAKEMTGERPSSVSSKARTMDLEGEAERLFLEGQWQAVFNVLNNETNLSERAYALACKSCANLRKYSGAETFLNRGVKSFPMSAELWFLHSLLSLEQKQFAAAIGSLRRVIFLDSSIVAAHLHLAFIQQLQHDYNSAMKSYLNVLRLCSKMELGEMLMWCNGQTVGEILDLASLTLEKLGMGGHQLDEQ